MYIEVPLEDLRIALREVESIVPKRDTETLFSNLLIQLNERKLYITASDMESMVQTFFPIESEERGAFLVRAAKFIDIVKNLRGERVEIELQEEESEEEKRYIIHIRAKGKRAFHAQIAGQDASFFPPFPEIPEEKLYMIPSGVLQEMIEKTIYALSPDDNRYIYNGLFFDVEGSFLTLVGTDARRLSLVKRELSSPMELGKEDFHPIVHSKALKELLRLLKEDTECYLGLQDKTMYFAVGNSKLSTRLIEGRFPDYKQVIPTEFRATFRIEREELLHSLREVMPLSEQPSFQVKLAFPKEDTIQLETQNPEMSTNAEVFLPAEIEGEPFPISFNANYLMDVLKNLTSSQVEISLVGEEKPIVVRDIEDKDFLALIMPIRA